MHPIIDEILRARLPIRPDVHRRWSDVLRNEIQPQLDELAEWRSGKRFMIPVEVAPFSTEPTPKKGRVA